MRFISASSVFLATSLVQAVSGTFGEPSLGGSDAQAPSSAPLYVPPESAIPSLSRISNGPAPTSTLAGTTNVSQPEDCNCTTPADSSTAANADLDDETLIQAMEWYRNSQTWSEDATHFLDIFIETLHIQSCTASDTILSDSTTSCGNRAVQVLKEWRKFAEPYEQGEKESLERRSVDDTIPAPTSDSNDAEDPEEPADSISQHDLSAWIQKFLLVLKTLKFTQETGEGQNTTIEEATLVLSQFVAEHNQSEIATPARSIGLASASHLNVRDKEDPEDITESVPRSLEPCVKWTSVLKTSSPTQTHSVTESASTTLTSKSTTITIFIPASTPSYTMASSAASGSASIASPTASSLASNSPSDEDEEVEGSSDDDDDSYSLDDEDSDDSHEELADTSDQSSTKSSDAGPGKSGALRHTGELTLLAGIVAMTVVIVSL